MLTFYALGGLGTGQKCGDAIHVNPAAVAYVKDCERRYDTGGYVRCAEIHMLDGSSVVVIDHAGKVGAQLSKPLPAPAPAEEKP